MEEQSGGNKTAGSQTGGTKTEKHCIVCGALLTGNKKVCCSPECRKIRRNQRERESYKPCGSQGLYRMKTCPDCGMEFWGHIKSYRCKECQAEADKKATKEYRQRKAAGKTRELGGKDLCERCGAEYVITAGLQKYCADCAEQANREHHAKRMREINARPEVREAKAERRRREPINRICCVCGMEFTSKVFAITCSEDCRAVHMAAWHAAYEARRKEQKAVYNRARWEAMNDEERKKINQRARELYQKRKEKQKN